LKNPKHTPLNNKIKNKKVLSRHSKNTKFSSILIILILYIYCIPIPANAGVVNVGTTGGLIDAILLFNVDGKPHVINLEPGTYSLVGDFGESIGIPVGLPPITGIISIVGADPESTIIERDPNSIQFGIFLVESTGNLTLENLTVTGADSVDMPGGGVQNNGILEINNSFFIQNSSSNGGAITNFGDLNITDSTLFGNSALVGRGGGIYTELGSITDISGGVIRGNMARVGGGISNAGNMTIVDSIISGNVSTIDNGLNGGGGIENAPGGDLSIKSSVLTANTADIGAGIHTENKSVTNIIGSTISDNNADTAGGGIRNGGFMDITMSTINGNRSSAPITGGGIRNLATINIANSTISGNLSGISNLGVVNMNNVTIASNDKTGILNADDLGAVLNLKNSIIADNSVPFPSDTDPDCFGTITSDGYNLIETVSVNCMIEGDTTGNIIGVDPILLPLGDYGGLTQTHALDPNSPAVDAGNPATPGSGGDACELLDQRGVERNCDCGAFELADGEDPMPDEGGDDIAAGSSSSGCSMTTGIIKPITITFNIIILLTPVFVVGLRLIRKRKISE